jgi:hypothetical protein
MITPLSKNPEIPATEHLGQKKFSSRGLPVQQQARQKTKEASEVLCERLASPVGTY